MGNPVVHFEIGCKNSEKTQAFYSKLFDWDVTEHGPAAMISMGSRCRHRRSYINPWP